MVLTRRGFCSTGFGAFLLRGGQRASDDCPVARIELDRLSAITDEVARTPAEAVTFAKKYGLRWVELRTVPGGGKLYSELPVGDLRKLKQELNDAGLGVSFLNTWLLKISLPGTDPLISHGQPAAQWAEKLRTDTGRFDKRLDSLKQAVEAAHILDVKIIRIFTFWRVQEPRPLFRRIADILAEMTEVAQREDIRLLVENESACNVATSEELTALMALLPSRAIGINWDPHNALPYEPNPFPAGYRVLPRGRIGNVQIKGESLLISGEVLNWRAVMHCMVNEGYPGKFGLETHFGDGEERISNAHASIKQIVGFLPNG